MKSGRGERWRSAALAALAVVPLLALAAVAASGVAIPRAARWLWLAVALLWLAAWMVAAARDRARHLRLIASLLQGLREGDYAARVRAGTGPLGEVWREFNALAAKLGGEERRGLETDALLSQLLGGLELAVLILDEGERLVDLNPAAEQLLGKPAAELVGCGAVDLGLSDWLSRSVGAMMRNAFSIRSSVAKSSSASSRCSPARREAYQIQRRNIDLAATSSMGECNGIDVEY